ncbi:MAG: YcgL domain-containing protein [Pseudomonadota bacterium]
MRCWIYKGSKRAETYVFLAREDDFETIPGALLEAMGTLQRVMDLDLASRTHLARADIEQVRAALVETGYYLQLPPMDGARPS